MQEMQVRSVGWEDILEKEMASYSSILAWEIPWIDELGGLYSPWGCKRVRYNLGTKQQQQSLAAGGTLSRVQVYASTASRLCELG